MIEQLSKSFLNYSGEKKNEGAWGVIMSLAAVALLGLHFWQQWRNKKKLAGLQHEKNLNAELKHQAEIKEREGHNLSEISKNLIEEKRLTARIAIIDAQMKANAAEHQRMKETIDALQDWDDISIDSNP